MIIETISVKHDVKTIKDLLKTARGVDIDDKLYHKISLQLVDYNETNVVLAKQTDTVTPITILDADNKIYSIDFNHTRLDDIRLYVRVGDDYSSQSSEELSVSSEMSSFSSGADEDTVAVRLICHGD